MKNSLQSALAQVGEEILRDEMEPSCYARALAKAGGNTQEGLAVYIDLRADELRSKIDKQKRLEDRRISAMDTSPAVSLKTTTENDLLRPAILLLSIFVSSTTLFSFVCIHSSNPLCENDLFWSLSGASVVTTLVLFIGLFLNYKLHQTTLHQLLLPVTIIFAISSFAGASKIIARPDSVVWQSQK